MDPSKKIINFQKKERKKEKTFAFGFICKPWLYSESTWSQGAWFGRAWMVWKGKAGWDWKGLWETVAVLGGAQILFFAPKRGEKIKESQIEGGGRVGCGRPWQRLREGGVAEGARHCQFWPEAGPPVRKGPPSWEAKGPLPLTIRRSRSFLITFNSWVFEGTAFQKVQPWSEKSPWGRKSVNLNFFQIQKIHNFASVRFPLASP